MKRFAFANKQGYIYLTNQTLILHQKLNFVNPKHIIVTGCMYVCPVSLAGQIILYSFQKSLVFVLGRIIINFF